MIAYEESNGDPNSRESGLLRRANFLFPSIPFISDYQVAPKVPATPGPLGVAAQQIADNALFALTRQTLLALGQGIADTFANLWMRIGNGYVTSFTVRVPFTNNLVPALSAYNSVVQSGIARNPVWEVMRAAAPGQEMEFVNENRHLFTNIEHEEGSFMSEIGMTKRANYVFEEADGRRADYVYTYGESNSGIAVFNDGQLPRQIRDMLDDMMFDITANNGRIVGRVDETVVAQMPISEQRRQNEARLHQTQNGNMIETVNFDKNTMAQFIDTHMKMHQRDNGVLFMAVPTLNTTGTGFRSGAIHQDAGRMTYMNTTAVEMFYCYARLNYVIGFFGIFVVVAVFVNFAFGLIQRLLYLVVLYIMSPITLAMYPFDDGAQFKSAFFTPFYKNVISVYAILISMNVFFMLWPIFDTIRFWPGGLWHPGNLVMHTFMSIALLGMLPKVRSTIQEMLGAGTVDEKGIAETWKNANKATGGTLGMAAKAPIVYGDWKAAHSAKKLQKTKDDENKKFEADAAARRAGMDAKTKGMSEAEKNHAWQNFDRDEANLRKNHEKDMKNIQPTAKKQGLVANKLAEARKAKGIGGAVATAASGIWHAPGFVGRNVGHGFAMAGQGIQAAHRALCNTTLGAALLDFDNGLLMQTGAGKAFVKNFGTKETRDRRDKLMKASLDRHTATAARNESMTHKNLEAAKQPAKLIVRNAQQLDQAAGEDIRSAKEILTSRRKNQAAFDEENARKEAKAKTRLASSVEENMQHGAIAKALENIEQKYKGKSPATMNKEQEQEWYAAKQLRKLSDSGKLDVKDAAVKGYVNTIIDKTAFEKDLKSAMDGAMKGDYGTMMSLNGNRIFTGSSFVDKFERGSDGTFDETKFTKAYQTAMGQFDLLGSTVGMKDAIAKQCEEYDKKSGNLSVANVSDDKLDRMMIHASVMSDPNASDEEKRKANREYDTEIKFINQKMLVELDVSTKHLQKYEGAFIAQIGEEFKKTMDHVNQSVSMSTQALINKTDEFKKYVVEDPSKLRDSFECMARGDMYNDKNVFRDNVAMMEHMMTKEGRTDASHFATFYSLMGGASGAIGGPTRGGLFGDGSTNLTNTQDAIAWIYRGNHIQKQKEVADSMAQRAGNQQENALNTMQSCAPQAVEVLNKLSLSDSGEFTKAMRQELIDGIAKGETGINTRMTLLYKKAMEAVDQEAKSDKYKDGFSQNKWANYANNMSSMFNSNQMYMSADKDIDRYRSLSGELAQVYQALINIMENAKGGN